MFRTFRFPADVTTSLQPQELRAVEREMNKGRWPRVVLALVAVLTCALVPASFAQQRRAITVTILDEAGRVVQQVRYYEPFLRAPGSTKKGEAPDNPPGVPGTMTPVPDPLPPAPEPQEIRYDPLYFPGAVPTLDFTA